MAYLVMVEDLTLVNGDVTKGLLSTLLLLGGSQPTYAREMNIKVTRTITKKLGSVQTAKFWIQTNGRS